MQLQVMTVTPEMAQHWLTKNGKNRRFSPVHAERIAKSIRAGEWSLNGETICFDDKGRLLDGQHRLSAIVRAGFPVSVAIATGVSDPRAFVTYDGIQRTRKADQIAEMKGVKQSRRVTSSARVVVAWEESRSMGEFHRFVMGGHDITPSALSDKALEIQDEDALIRQMIGENLIRMSRVGSALIGILVVLNRIDPVNTHVFLEKVRTGVMDNQDDPALVYRDRLMSGNGIFRNERRWRVAAMAITVKAWNAHKSGSTVKTLRFRQEGDNPERFPAPLCGGKPNAD